jgi:hypothetical protein
VTFTIHIYRERAFRPIHLAGEGEVVRVEKSATDAMFLIAVQSEHPITQLEEHLPEA